MYYNNTLPVSAKTDKEMFTDIQKSRGVILRYSNSFNLSVYTKLSKMLFWRWVTTQLVYYDNSGGINLPFNADLYSQTYISTAVLKTFSSWLKLIQE